MSLVALPDGSVRPEVLADPYRLYARLRADTPVVFDRGIGSHQCPGSSLARTEAAAAVRALLTALGSIRLAQEPVWKDSFTFRGPSTLVATTRR